MTSLKTILMSRFRKPSEEAFVEERRNICLNCPDHSFNRKVPLKISIIKFLSDIYSKVTGKENEDNLGNCGICGCSTYYSTAEPENSCSAEKEKWKSIYIPNSSETKNGKKIYATINRKH